MPSDPKFWLTGLKFCGKFKSEFRSGMRCRNGELLGELFSPIWVIKPQRGVLCTLWQKFELTGPKTPTANFFGSQGVIMGRFCVSNRFPVWGDLLFQLKSGLVRKSANGPLVPKKVSGGGFGYGVFEFLSELAQHRVGALLPHTGQKVPSR